MTPPGNNDLPIDKRDALNYGYYSNTPAGKRLDEMKSILIRVDENMKDVKKTLDDHGKKLEEVTKKVTEHEVKIKNLEKCVDDVHCSPKKGKKDKNDADDDTWMKFHDKEMNKQRAFFYKILGLVVSIVTIVTGFIIGFATKVIPGVGG